MNDVRVSGFKDFTPDGSIYGNVTVSGSGDVMGDLRCMSFTLSGSGDVSGFVESEGGVVISGAGDITKYVHAGGNVKISGAGDIGGEVISGGEVRISGAGDIHGRVECAEFVLSGAGDVGGDVECEGSFTLSGAGDIRGSVKALSVELRGAGSIKKDVSCENARLTGASTVGGLLNAEEIYIELGRVHIGEIGCTKLEVREKEVRFGHSNNSPLLECKSIEGDDITLTYTVADVVRGKNIKIGRHCDIKRVEYSENIEVDDSSAVKSLVRI